MPSACHRSRSKGPPRQAERLKQRHGSSHSFLRPFPYHQKNWGFLTIARAGCFRICVGLSTNAHTATPEEYAEHGGRISVPERPRSSRQRDDRASPPERRPRLLQPAAEPHGSDALREPGVIVGLDRERAQGRNAHGRLEAPSRNLAQKTVQRLVL